MVMEGRWVEAPLWRADLVSDRLLRTQDSSLEKASCRPPG